MISLRRTGKETERKFVVDVAGNTSARGTLSVRKPDSLFPSLAPAYSASFGLPTTVARMACTLLVLGLPLCHAEVSAKHLVGMEVGGGAVNVIATPSARLDNAIASGRIAASFVSGIATVERAILLRPASSRECSATRRASPWFCFAESGSDVARMIAEAGAFGNAARRQRLMTVFTVHACKVSQDAVLVKRGIEKDARYFETARARLENELRQGLLPLTHNDKVERTQKAKTGENE